MPESLLDLLTPAERRAAELYAAGHAYEEIARRLSIKLNTVKRHLGTAREKFECQNQTEFRAKFERVREEEADRRSHDFSGEWLFRVLWFNKETKDSNDIYASLLLGRASPRSAYYASETGLVATHQILRTGPPENAREQDELAIASPLDVLFSLKHRVRAVASSQFDVHHLTLEWIDGNGGVCAAVVMKLDRDKQKMDGELGGFCTKDEDCTLVDPDIASRGDARTIRHRRAGVWRSRHRFSACF